ncbi:MAG: hypothetical protein R3E89_01450 [Thiolinea sp.]
MAVRAGQRVATVVCADALEVEGINNRVQLARLEREAQRRQVEALMLAGVTVADPARLDIRGEVSSGGMCSLTSTCCWKDRCNSVITW